MRTRFGIWAFSALIMVVMMVLLAPICVADQDADARDSLTVSPSVSPPGMVVPTEAQVYLMLVNSTTDPITDITVSKPDGTVLADVGTLSGTDKSNFVFSETLTPTKKQLKAEGIEYLIKYTLAEGTPGEIKRKITVIAPITHLQAEPGLDFSRKPTSNYAKSGEEVTITYRLRNTGNVQLTDIELKDELCGEVGRAEKLDPGKKITFNHSVVINGNSDSLPQVSYTYPGYDGRLTKRLDAVTIFQADEQLDAHLDADRSAVSPGEVVNLVLKLKNQGNVSYEKLEIKDHVLGTIGSLPMELKPGDEYVFTKQVNVKSTTTFLFNISGKSAAGNPTSAISNMLTVAVTPAVSSVKMSVSAEADNATLGQPGPVNFTVHVNNAGDMDIRNVVISERNFGEIKTLAVAPPGDTPVQCQYYVKENTSFVFMAEVTDAAQGELTVLSNPPVDVTVMQGPIIPDGAPSAPQASAILGIADTAYHMSDGDSIFRRMVGLVLIVLTLLLIALLVNSLARIGKRRRIKQLHMRKLRRIRRDVRTDGGDLSVKTQDTGRYEKLQCTGVYKRAELVTRKESV